MTKTCHRCQEEFEPVNMARDNCEHCRAKMYARRAEKKCIGCGKQFNIKQRAHILYCSKRCQRSNYGTVEAEVKRAKAFLERQEEWPEVAASLERLKRAWSQHRAT